MSSLEDEILEIENYIKTLETNDDSYVEINAMIKDGMEKGLIYDFYNWKKAYRGTMFSPQIIKKEEYDDFQKYIDRCEEKVFVDFKKWRDDVIASGIEFSKDELKYNKMI